MHHSDVSSELEYHTYLHHSQTETSILPDPCCLSTIHTYIILKREYPAPEKLQGLSTIHIYIILKPWRSAILRCERLSTIHIYIILKPLCSAMHMYSVLEYHTYLHHSQTVPFSHLSLSSLEYHTYLHHSQTPALTSLQTKELEYHTYLHHSQTLNVDSPRMFCLSTIHIYIILKPQIQK